ncbi:MAG: methylated-DNA--[protein]-cysteine S-methyltransferase [Alphaproteobacteria bacterium]|nr:methylated-DNA--[protein]-cysteine S-methyltransferase [Alphaproteobacteria bacterium]
MTAKGFTLFATPIGTCALAWGERGIVGASLPSSGEAETRARMRARYPGAAETEAPPDIARTVDDIRALLEGKPTDLAHVALDMHGVPDFHRRVYDAARAIPPGQTLTYGELAEKLEAPDAARAVGQALGANPFPIIVPCHRILAAGGKTGGFSAPGGTTTKMRMLTIEGAKVNRSPSLFDQLPLLASPRRAETAALGNYNFTGRCWYKQKSCHPGRGGSREPGRRRRGSTRILLGPGSLTFPTKLTLREKSRPG